MSGLQDKIVFVSGQPSAQPQLCVPALPGLRRGVQPQLVSPPNEMTSIQDIAGVYGYTKTNLLPFCDWASEASLMCRRVSSAVGSVDRT